MIDFTVVIPVFNTAPAHLFECVHSIREQTIKEKFKILLVDDCSDNYETKRALDHFEMVPNINVFRLETNQGTSGALNKAHEIVETPYIALCGSQDVFDRNKLLVQTEYLNKNRHVSVLSTQLFSFEDSDINRTPLWTSSHKLMPSIMDNPSNPYFIANHGTVLYSNQHVKDAGGYNLDFRRGQDVDLWKRMYAKGMMFHCLPGVCYGWRKFNK